MKRDHTTDNLLRAIDAEQDQQGTIEGARSVRDWLTLGNLLRAALVAALAALYVNGTLPEAPAKCDTDADCMRSCPPPNDDPDCDGGPE